ncbi:MAG TPA: hypothetical protein VJ992_08635 [Gemmatimonadales bacterium]|nr:hypothetical protein [Gemmatimonadales bacterium]
MRSGLWFVAVAASLGALTSPAHAQRTGRGGVMVGAELLRASAFSLTETRSDGGVARQATIAASTGLAFHVSFFALPWLAPFASGETFLYGHELSGYTIVRGGVELRAPVTGPVSPRVAFGLGRFAESGGVASGLVTLDAGAEWYPVRRMAVTFVAGRTLPFAASADTRAGAGAPLSATVDGQWRAGVGLAVRLGGG